MTQTFTMKCYQFASLLAQPVITMYLKKRQAAGKEHPQRFPERLGYASLPRPEGKLVWVHCASVGESISILPLINRLCERHTDIRVMLTTGTVTSAKMMGERLPARAFHQFIPVDTLPAVKRFLKHWKPDLALWVESEFWPNLLMETAKAAPVLLLNARVSNTSFAKWQRYKGFIKQMLASFSLCLPQSEEDGRRLSVLGAEKITYIGNLKYDAPALPTDEGKMQALQAMIGERQLWAAASTHPGEEEQLAEAHKILKETYNDILTTIIPRHAHRGSDIAAMLRSQGFNVSLRSNNEPIQPETDIYLADTMGELGIFYRLAPIVYIGGSLVPHGGQNPLEAARLDCAILAGPHMENFTEISHELEEGQAMQRVESSAALAKAVDTLISDHAVLAEMKEAALNVANAKGKILDGYLEEMSGYIEKSPVVIPA